MPASLIHRLRPISIRALPLFASLLLLAGCTSQQPHKTANQHTDRQTVSQPARPQPPQAPQLSDWQQYQQVLLSIKRWQVQGKLGIRLPNDSGSVYFNWQQRPEDFAIHLSGPLGAGASWIRGSSLDAPHQQVSLQRGKQAPVYADNLETLMYGNLGWSLPVSELYYWMRGIPAPDTPATAFSHDDQGRLETLQQLGWTLNFSRYREVDSWSLPGKLIAKRGELKLTFIIKNWTL